MVLSCGVNDAVEGDGAWRVPFEASVAAVREILTGAIAKYQLLMVGPPPVADAAHNERILSLSCAYSRAADAIGIPYIELFSALFPDAGYRGEVSRNDGAHPRSAGYAKMAEIIAASPDWWFRAP